MESAFDSVHEDHPEPVACTIKGLIPDWLNGCLIRNGSAKWDIGDDTYNHWFDGLGMLHKYSFKDGMVTYQNRFLDSESTQKTLASNRIVVSQFGTVAYPDPCKSIFTRYFSYFMDSSAFDNCNVNVLEMGDVLYAMTETNMLHKVDPQTLNSDGQFNLGKIITCHTATAHPLQDQDGTTFNLASQFGKVNFYHIIKVPPGGKGDENPLDKARLLTSIPSSRPHYPAYYHSFAMTENYIVFIEQPFVVNPLKFMLTTKLLRNSYKDCLSWLEGEDVIFHIINKADGKQIARCTAPACAFFHQINSYEDNNHIILDIVAYENSDVFQELSIASLRLHSLPATKNFVARYALPLDVSEAENNMSNLINLDYTTASASKNSKTGYVHCTPEILLSNPRALELPRINGKLSGKKYRYAYASDFHVGGLTKLDTLTKECKDWQQEGLLAGEPVFIANPGATEEDDGVILSPLTSLCADIPPCLLVLDAATFKEIGRGEMPEGYKIPYTFHGLFSTKL